MYESYFGFRERPFNITPDPRFLYLSTKHREALAHLIYGVKEKKGFVVLSGEVGTGKTTLIRALLERLDTNFQVAYVLNPDLGVTEFFKFISHDFGLQVNGDSKVDYLIRLQDFILKSHRGGKTTVLIVDEAQYLEAPLFREIRMLTNLETPQQKLLQVLLVGQPELNDYLERPDFRQIKQRISIRYHLLPLDQHETQEYIQTRMRIAGAKSQDCFTEGALQKIYEHSGGVPRLINNICDNSLLTAFATDRPIIDEQIVGECVADLRLGRGRRKPRAERRMQRDVSFWHSAFFAVLVTVLIALLAGGIVLFLSGKGNVPRRLSKLSETIQSFSQRSQETAVKDGSPVEEEITEGNQAISEPQPALKMEIPPGSSITEERETDLILEQKGQKEAGDTVLEVEGEREERSVSLYGTEAPGSPAEEIAQAETPGAVTTPDESFPEEQGILILLGETEGSEKKVKEVELSKEVSVDDSRESEERETLARIPVETLDDVVSEDEGLEENSDEEMLYVAEPKSPPQAPEVRVIQETREEPLEREAEELAEKEIHEEEDFVLAQKKEVKQFFATYIDQYNKKNIRGLLSLFSSKAMQNGRDGFDDIQRIYSGFFNQSQELRYRLEHMRIEIYQNAVVRARYEMVQILKRTGEKRIWRGDIRWVLVRENGNLRVRYLDYKQERFPQERKRRRTEPGTRAERDR